MRHHLRGSPRNLDNIKGVQAQTLQLVPAPLCAPRHIHGNLPVKRAGLIMRQRQLHILVLGRLDDQKILAAVH